MYVILATWETEIRRTEVSDQLRQKVCNTISQPIPKCSGVHLLSQAMQEAVIRRIVVPG
jgi:hypothetical protein